MSITINRMDDKTWSLEEEGVRFFLLEGRDKALLIDSGMKTANAREVAQSLTDLPLELLNTHSDPDHISGNGQFDFAYMHPAECGNYYKAQNRSGVIRPVWDGDVIDLGERKLEIIHMPGHTPGSIAVLDVKNRRLFGGDPIQDGSIFMFGAQREMHGYRHSLKRLAGMTGRFDEICPSHGSCPVKPDMIDKLYEAAGKILDGSAKGKAEEMFGTPILVYDMGMARFLCDRD